MSKPRDKDEAHLRRKYKLEDEIPYEIEREARENKRIWKRQTQKVNRRKAKQDIKKGLERDEDQ